MTDLQVLMKLLDEDPDFVESRAPSTVIRKGGHLALDEKLRLRDLLHEYARMPGNDPDLSPSELYKSFFDDIFKCWTSAHAVSQGPTLPRREPGQSCIGIDDSWVVMPLVGRRLCVPVYLTMEFDPEKETFAWIWRDQSQELLTPEELKLRLPKGVTTSEAIVAVIGHYDNIERERVTSYNRGKIVNAARRRIRYFALAGSSDDTEFGGYDFIQDGDIIPLILASEAYLKNTRFAIRMAAAIERGLYMTPA